MNTDSRDITTMDCTEGIGEIFKRDDGDYLSYCDGLREVCLTITSFVGNCYDAIHYYGTLKISDLCFKKIDDPNDKGHSFGGYRPGYPESAEGSILYLTRMLTSDELKTERFQPYKEGDFTNCFNSREDLIAYAAQEFYRIFCQYDAGWGLTIDDRTI